MIKILSSHKNTIEKKRRRDVQREVDSFGKLLKDVDVRAYAVVAIDAKGEAHCIWDTGSIVPMWAFVPTISECLKRDLEESCVEETWKPPLPIKG